MTAATRLLRASDPARHLDLRLDARAERELTALIGPDSVSPQSPARLSPLPRRLPAIATGLVSAAVAAVTVAVLVAAPAHRGQVGQPTASASPHATSAHAVAPAIGLVRAVWHVEGADGEGDDTWLRFTAHGAQVLRGPRAVAFGWRAQGRELLFTPDDYPIGLGGTKTVRWLEASTAFRADGNGFDLLDIRGTVTARLVHGGTPPKRPISVDGTVRATLADARTGPVRSISTTALRGAWRLAGDSRLNAWISFRSDGSWITDEHCLSAEGPETDLGGYRLLESGVVLITVQPGQEVACENGHADGASISTLAVLLQGRSIRIDDDTATVYDSRGSLLARLVRF